MSGSEPPWLIDKEPVSKYPRLNLSGLEGSCFSPDLNISKLARKLVFKVPRSTFDDSFLLSIQSKAPQRASCSTDKLSRERALKANETRSLEKAFEQPRIEVCRVFDESDDQSVSQFAATNAANSGLYETEVVKCIEKFHEKPKRGFREKQFASITKSREFLGYCICCGFSPANRMHPLFKHAGLCSHCEPFLKKLPDIIDPRDGYQANCTICCRQGVDLCMCDSGRGKCLRSFCFQCLNLFLGSGGAQSIKSVRKWYCFFCEGQNLGLLQVRKHWKAAWEKFTKSGAKINSKLNLPSRLPPVQSSSSSSSSLSSLIANHSSAKSKSEPIKTKTTEAAQVEGTPTTTTGKNMRTKVNGVSNNPSQKPSSSQKEEKKKVRDDQVEFSDEDDTLLSQLRLAEQTQKDNMELSPAGSDIANNNCLPASCDRNLISTTCNSMSKVKFSIHDEDDASTSTPIPTASCSDHRSSTSISFSRILYTSGAKPLNDVFSSRVEHTRSKRFAGCSSSVHLKKYCLCCTSKNVAIPHPIFMGGVCEDCLPVVTKNLITIMEVGQDDEMDLDLEYLKNMCCVCCQNANSPKSASQTSLFRCSEDSCFYSFCERCIAGLVSQQIAKYLASFANGKSSVVLAPSWTCYLCCDSQFQGLLKLQI